MRVFRWGVMAAMLFLTAAAGATPVTNADLETLGADGFPVDWERVGETVTVSTDAHSGQVAFHLLRTPDTPTAETGVNRAWRPDSGERGAMLDRLQGGIVFWYKALAQDKPGALTVQVIPMSARPFEDTGASRVVFVIPEPHVGDGAWRQGAVKYDFSDNPQVKWVHISPRLLGPGELLLDDFAWTDRIGPALDITEVALLETEDAPGRRAALRVTVVNRGDETSAPTTLSASAPAGLYIGPAQVVVPALAPDGKHEVSFTLDGERREAGAVQVSLAGPTPSAAAARFAAGAALERVTVERFILAPGEETTLRATVANTGGVIIPCPAVAVAGEGAAIHRRGDAPDELPPGRAAALEWVVSPTAENPAAEIQVTADLPDGMVTETVRLVCLRRQGEPLTIGDERRTLAVWRTNLGYGLCDLIAYRDGEARVAARMPYLARIAFEMPSGARGERYLYGLPLVRDQAGMAFEAAFTDAEGATWRFRVAYYTHGDRARFKADYRLSVDQPRTLLAFDGPMLYVAEGTNATRRDGLFPGLEWLVEGEESSSDLDIEADHPDRLRYVPHPNKVTIPLMAVRTDDALVGLLWDARQSWDGERDRPGAVFASPDRFEHRASHLLGLMLPSVPEFVAENERLAAHPYLMQPGRDLTLRALLVVEPDAPDVLAAQEAWIEEFGIPAPMPYPRGTLEGEIAFSAHAYLDSLWVEDQGQWLPYKHGPAIWAAPSRNPAFAYDLMLASVLAADAETRAACQVRLAQLAAARPLTAAADDLGHDYGRADHGLEGALSQALAAIDTQGADGAWRFDADYQDQGVFKGWDYHLLGEDEAAEVGTCARNAYVILLAARLTGARDAYEAGVRALRFMEQFTVPRAAQVWEVPVHTPDILAAADAVDAYLEAYRMDGDDHWLHQAVTWARRGLPFIYLWDDPQFPFMRYASIPVFGASWHQWSWFGNAVQWNGLRYAHALLKLAAYDDSLPWREIARGITVSAMYQQATEGPDLALWPDSIRLTDAFKSAWVFAPQQILKNVYHLMGRPAEPQTVMVDGPSAGSGPPLREGSGPSRAEPRDGVHINSGARISDAALSPDGDLTFRLTYPAHKHGTTTIVGLEAPGEVLLDGQPLRPAQDLLAADGAAYRYLPGLRALLVRVPAGSADLETALAVRVTGVRLAPVQAVPALVEGIAFDFEESAEGWSPTHDLGAFEVADGVLSMTVVGADPYIIRRRVRVEGDAVRAIAIRMATDAGAYGEFYWATQEAPHFAESRVLRFPLRADGEFHTYRIAVGEHDQWRGQGIAGIRLDPTSGVERANVRIDWIRGE